MAAKWKALKNADGKGGVRYREHPTRKHGAVPDRCYVLSYWWWTIDKKTGKRKKGTINEPVGWASNGWTPSKCFNQLAIIKKNQDNKKGPCTLKDLRKSEEAKELAKTDRDFTLDQYWPIYLESRKQNKKFSSWDKEESHYKHWLSPVLGNKSLKDINMESWDKLVAALYEKSERTKEYITGTLRRILKHAKTREIINFDPPSPKAIGVTGPGSKNRRLRAINNNEAKAILKELAEIDKNAWRITRFAFLTGCRASEAFNLKWREIDEIKGVLTFAETKNQDSRQLAISEPLKKLFSEISRGELEDYVFLRHDGKPYTESPPAFRQVVTNLEFNKGRRKLDRILFHSIRHTVATELVNHLNLRDFMDIMGWRTVEMAMRYVKGNEKAKTTALADLERNLIS